MKPGKFIFLTGIYSLHFPLLIQLMHSDTVFMTVLKIEGIRREDVKD
ncbi:MAG: hypothetical protein JNM19_00215 [Chitinophagaceae bacterium]|nr:hypothetical protein [Chitinophagaceae bacterium]